MFLYFYYILQILIVRYGLSLGESIATKNIKHLTGQIDTQDGTNDYESSSSVDSNNMDAVKYKRVLLQSNYDSYDPTLLKNTIDDKNIDYRTSRESFPYGIVYNNGKPLGILEPLPREYQNIKNLEVNIKRQEQPLDNTYPLRKVRENSYVGKNFEEPKHLLDNPYPIIANEEQENKDANSKRDTEKSNENKSQQKRESALENSEKESTNVETASVIKRGSGCCKKSHKQHQNENEDQDQENSNENGIMDSSDKSKKHIINVDDNHIQELKTTLDKLKNPSSSEEMEAVERNLRSLLIEMGLAEKDVGLERSNIEVDGPLKRSIYSENGENLEGKTIEITEFDKLNERSKREDNKKDIKHRRDKNQLSESIITKHFKKKETDKKNKNSEINRNAKEDTIRTKRAQEKTDASEIMKNMESELTISGNKSPLASTGNLNSPLNQNAGPSAFSGADTNQLSYQERIERNIQSKIDAIKEEVRREIETLRNKEKRSIIQPHSDESSRKKRQTALNLLNEETPEIDPSLNIENNLKPLIRKRRHTQKNTNEEQKLEDKPNVNNDDITKKSVIPKNEETEDNLNSMDNVKLDESIEKGGSSEKLKDALYQHKRNLEIETKEQDVETNHKIRNRRGLSLEKKAEDVLIKDKAKSRLQRKKREAYENVRDYSPDEYSYRRRKRGDGPYFPSRDDDYEMDIEGDEFGEEGYYDTNKQRRRQTEYDNNYNSNLDTVDSDFLNSNPSVNYANNRYRRFVPRRRRQEDDQILDDEIRLKREREFKTRDENERQQLSDLPETDLFGALPQSYVGELARYKRVKRQKGS